VATESIEEVDHDDGTRTVNSTSKRIKTLADLLEACQVDLDAWEVQSQKLNAWEQNSQEGGLVTLYQVKAHLVPKAVPLRPAVQTFASPPPPPIHTVTDGELVFVVPDTQHGIRWLDPRRRTAVTTHDQQAIEVALALAEDLQPDTIVFLGDDLDAAEVGKYRKDWTVMGTLQATLDILHYNLARFRASCPRARIVMLAGNHDQRVSDYVVDNASALDGLRLAGTDTPALHVPSLLRLDDLHIEWRGPYGRERYYMHTDVDPIAFQHAGKLRSNSAESAKATLAAALDHVCVGHEHRTWHVSKTLWGPKGPREISAMSPGALTRIGGVVPGVSSTENWQQAIGLVWLEDVTTQSLVPITKGSARHGFRKYDAPDGLRELAEATGWGQLWDGRDATLG
jgi:hypothetical protein